MAGFDERFGIDQEAFPADPAERRRLIDAYRSKYMLESSQQRANRRAAEAGYKFKVPAAADWSVEPDAWAAADRGPSNVVIEGMDDPEVAGARNEVPMPPARPDEAPQTSNIRAKAAAVRPPNAGLFEPVPPMVDPRQPDPNAVDDRAPWEMQLDAMAEQDRLAAERRARQGTIAQPEAGIRGMNQGATLNWGEEIGGLQAASGVPGSFGTSPVGLIAGGMRTGLGGLRLLGEKMGLPGQAGERYDAYVKAERDRNAEAAAQHPRTYYGSEIATGLALPVPGAAATRLDTAGRLVPAFGRRMAAGATQGAIAGAGGGEGVQGKIMGGGLGAGVGAILPAAHSFVSPIVGRPANAVRNYFDPEGAARRATGAVVNAHDQALAEAARRGVQPRAHVNEGELRSEWARTGGQGSAEGPVIADVAGAPGGTLTRAAGNADVTAQETIENRLIPRKDLAGQRLSREIDQNYAQPSAAAAEGRITADSAATVSPAYVSVFRHSPEDLTKKAPFFNHISNNSTHVQRAESDAVKDLQTRYALDGKVWGGVKNAEYWDTVKKQLDLAHAAAEAKPGTDADLIDTARKAILQRMDKLVPGYRQARAGGAEIAGERSSLALGTKMAKANVATERQRAAIAAMPPEEKALFVEGYLTHVKDVAGGSAASSATQALNKLRALQQIPGAMTVQQSRDAIDMIRRATGMRMTEGAAMGNSTTARQLQSADLVSASGAGLGAYGALDDRHDPGKRFTIGSGLTLAGIAGIISRRLPPGTSPIIAQRIAEGMMSQDPKVLAAAREAFQRAQRARLLRGATTARGSRAGAQYVGEQFSGQE